MTHDAMISNVSHEAIESRLLTAMHLAHELLEGLQSLTYSLRERTDADGGMKPIGKHLSHDLKEFYAKTTKAKPIIGSLWLKHAAVAEGLIEAEGSVRLPSRHHWCLFCSERLLRGIKAVHANETNETLNATESKKSISLFYETLDAGVLNSEFIRTRQFVQRFKDRWSIGYSSNHVAFAEVSRECARALHLPRTSLDEQPSLHTSLNQVGKFQRTNSKVLKALEFIRENGPIKGILIARHLGIEESSLRSHYIPRLLEMGVRNDRSGDGYYAPDLTHSAT